MNQRTPSVRQRLKMYVNSGRLRDRLEGKTETDVIDLLVGIAARYCTSKIGRRKSESNLRREGFA